MDASATSRYCSSLYVHKTNYFPLQQSVQDLSKSWTKSRERERGSFCYALQFLQGRIILISEEKHWKRALSIKGNMTEKLGYQIRLLTSILSTRSVCSFVCFPLISFPPAQAWAFSSFSVLTIDLSQNQHGRNKI
jgi:hypothetical protein